ncbi:MULTISPECIES: hypothetical protein [Pseudomonas]|uniref:Uncharacterized protein n=1 Tax=Pseudomonas hunanensis TaxID=1247546 RepID=A0ACC9MYE2_9PSED|nr:MULTISPECIES: hypothetical protein [Pseudomonas]HCF2575834.1 hypothetical protein [Pseudomonas aeruginosa]AGN82254.1 hypothetical protein L483_15000 [Pseudomonas putida H8234]MBP2086303.1 hypothetical protein [Pseudomonas sp. PvP089]MBP2092709.1 hypothetical protein [Pseudomonas sp. PvP088]MBP2226473.1 hypothetical protein [Pseudomonas putida]
MQHFQKAAVDRTDRQAMISFLAGHYRYDTMNHWNRSTSYAHCVKIHALGLDPEQTEKAFELLCVDYWDDLQLVIEDFVAEMDGEFTIGSNGRSSGYLVLAKSSWEYTGYQSYCRSCSQRNYQACTEGDNRCGRCGAEGESGRRNFQHPPKTLRVTGQAIDQDEDFQEWSLDQLASRVEVVEAFDRACDDIRATFISLLSLNVVEETVLIPQKRYVLQSA